MTEIDWDALQGALTMLDLGYTIVRCRPGAKQPRVSYSEQTRDPHVLAQWGADGETTFGVVPQDGQLIVDRDRADAPDWLARLPPTLMVTRGGRAHYYYSVPVGTTSRNGDRVDDCDIRMRCKNGAARSLVMAPGSLHPSGERYTLHPAQVASLPDLSGIPGRTRGARKPAPLGIDLDDPGILRVQWACPPGRSALEHAHHLALTSPPALQGDAAGTVTLRLFRAILWGLGLDEPAARPALEAWLARGVDADGQHWPMSADQYDHKVAAAQDPSGAPYPRGSLLPATVPTEYRCPPGVSLYDHALDLARQVGDGSTYHAILETGLGLGAVAREELLSVWSRHHGGVCPPPAVVNWPRGCLSPLPLVVTREDTFWFRRPDGTDYNVRCKATDAPLVAREFVAGHFGQEGRRLPAVSAIREASMPVLQKTCSYMSPSTSYDPATYTLQEGLRVSVEPRYDANTDTWLRTLGGAKYERLVQWIAGTRQDRLAGPSQCLALVGSKSAGKSMFAHALARVFGPLNAVPIKHVLAQFNGVMADCPVWLIDENRPKNLDSDEFRRLIVQNVHQVERKGQEKYTLHGCGRVVFAVNDVEKLYLDGSKNGDALDAIADRFLIIQAGPGAAETLEALRQPLGVLVDLDRIAGHFRWIQENVQPANNGRMIGASDDGETREILAAAELDQAPELLELLRDWADHRGDWEPHYALAPQDLTYPPRAYVPEARLHYPIFVHQGGIFVRTAGLAALLGIPSRETSRTLGPLRSGQARIKLQGHTCACYRLSPERLASAGVLVDLAISTKDYLPAEPVETSK